MDENSNIKVMGYDSDNDVWVEIQVDVNGALVVTV